MQETKAEMVKADRHLDGEPADRGEKELAKVGEWMGRLADLAKKDKGVRPFYGSYERAWALLKSKAELLPELDALRACHALCRVVLRKDAATPGSGGTEQPGEALRVVRSQVHKAEECAAIERRLSGVRSPADSLSLEVAPGQSMRLVDLYGEIKALQKELQNRQKVVQKEWEVVRARWVRVLFGDRLRIFQEHADTLPEYDGKARGPLPASVLPKWRYPLPDGRIEMFLFKKSKLLRKVIEDPRRS